MPHIANSVPMIDWIGFHLILLALLTVELIFSRYGLAALAPEERPARQHRNAVVATVMWVVAALLFAGYLLHGWGSATAVQFLAGYSMEESLSIDNLFVFLLLFRVFAIPPVFQPRVLFWGVLGAILLRGAFIAAGVQLLARFEWVSYVFAMILLGAAVRLVLPGEHGDPNATTTRAPRWARWISRIHPVSPRHDVFFTREGGVPMITMLALALIAIETSDIVFALDSIPAVLSITREPFVAYTSNILAVMGLRSLFFLLARMLRQLRFLHFGLAAILAFAALRMLAARWIDVGPLASLAVILGMLGITIAVSLLRPARPGEAL
jgi:tellurite resistance protein TerC